jgi:nucleoside-diphosphate-sugar epimerase
MIVISGASGFIGRRLTAAAKTHFSPVDLWCYASPSRCDYEQQGKAFLANREISFSEADFVGGAGLIKTSKKPEVVFHLAANSATWTDDHRPNDLGTQNFIHSLSGLGPGSHVIFTSTIAVADSRTNYGAPLTETTPTSRLPLTKYGLSKLRAELWLQDAAKRMGFSLTILRLVTVYGEDARPSTLFPVMRGLALKRSSLSRLAWPGLTGLIHVDDVVHLALSLAGKPPPSGNTEVYFAQAQAHSLAWVSQITHEFLNLPYEPISPPKYIWHTLSGLLSSLLRAGHRLPGRIYGPLWRLRLMTENVFWCDPAKIRRAVPDWLPLRLEDKIGEALA